MSDACTVVIASAALLDDLRRHIRDRGDILTFTDSETLTALEVISARRPQAVTLERLFAATSRGAALINRVKADPSLSQTEIRVVSHDGSYSRVSPRRTAGLAKPAPVPEAEPPAAVAVETTAPSPSAAMDYRGTRRAPRFRIVGGTGVQVDGSTATLVDLSTLGAQVVAAAPLKPQQRVRVVLSDASAVVKLAAAVAWASFEMPRGLSQYRAGLEFTDAQSDAVEAFCNRHLADQPKAAGD